MKLVSENKEFQIFFDSNTQEYCVYKDGKFLIGKKYCWQDVQSYAQ